MKKTLLLILILCLIVSPCVAEEIDVFKLAENGTLEQLQEALNNGAKFNVKDDEDYETPLHRAAAHNKNPEVIKFLIEQGIDVNAEGYMGHYLFTPLSCAIENENIEAVKELLKAGANSSVYISSRTPTPLHFIAVQYKNSPDDVRSMIEAIKNASGDVNVHTKLSKEDEEEFANYKTIFLPRNQWKSDDPIDNMRDFSNATTGNLLATLTPLMYAVLYDNPDVVNILLDVSADVNIRSAENKTAFDYANELPNNSKIKNSPIFDNLKIATLGIQKNEAETDTELADRLVGEGKIPMYVRDKGKFNHNPNCKKIRITGTNVNLRSQPNLKANVISQASKNELSSLINYIGEWTHPNGDKFLCGELDNGKIVWVSEKYSLPLTMEQYGFALLDIGDFHNSYNVGADSETAIKCYDLALSLGLTSRISELVRLCVSLYKNDEAMKYIKMLPENEVDQHVLAIVYDRNGEHDKARECIEKYMKDHPEITSYEMACQLYAEGMYQVAYDLIRKNLNTFDSKFLFAEIWTYHRNDIKIQDDDPATVGVFIGENIRRDKRVVDLHFAMRIPPTTAEDYYDKAFKYYACNKYTGPEFTDNLRIAAEMGYADAQYYWAEILGEGLYGVRQDETAAYNYYKKAAAQGHQGARDILSLYELFYRRRY